MRLQPAWVSAWLALTTTATTNAAGLVHNSPHQAVLAHSNDNGDGRSPQSEPQPRPANARARKNILLVLTDDQDAAMDSMSYMPLVQKYLSDQGTTYANHFTTTAVCCPSRVSLWTGKQPHNTNVTDVNPPHGGYPKFVSQGLNDNYLPVWLQQAGYNTYYTGKLFNAHSTANYDSPFPAGWTSTDFLLDPGTYSYLHPIYQHNADPPVHHHNEHTSSLITEKAQGLLAEALAALSQDETPFFLGVAPVAPHSDISPQRHAGPGALLPIMTEPIPLERHAALFSNVTIPRASPLSPVLAPSAVPQSNFNPWRPSGANWLRTLPQHNASAVAYLDHYYRQRLRSLQAVDELVEKLVLQLDAARVLDETYIVYTSDNGFHLGQHRLPPGKECGYEEDIRVPFVVRGPGVAKNRVETAVVSTHIDVAPTVLRMAGVEDMREDFDGVAMWAIGETSEREHGGDGVKRHEHVTVEYWGFALAEGEGGGFDGKGKHVITNNTYKAVRILGESYNLYYSVWCNNEHELYDLTTDPGQMVNLHPSSSSPASLQPGLDTISITASTVQIRKLLHRLDTLLMILKSCRGKTCIEPWSVLHPQGDVLTLGDALRPEFDGFYEAQTRVAFDRCEAGYIIEAEGPQAEDGAVESWTQDRGDEYGYREGTEWHMWV
ncbi:alkaline-phosphatase-like protein [Coniella lustricola]|uniref:Alkaline-phosphatase-like protein n=1 Tax=Coniella lustricola TaxID=2025994 RepID=A0A2T3AIJ0_9PEZI|nr:alkaline-phosphatase-like protein [Coniella lustricola]